VWDAIVMVVTSKDKNAFFLFVNGFYGPSSAPVITKPTNRCLYLVKATNISQWDALVVVVRKASDFVENEILEL